MFYLMIDALVAGLKNKRKAYEIFHKPLDFHHMLYLQKRLGEK